MQPVGHRHLRTALRPHWGSFALVGPAGVGKHAVVAEWLGDRPWDTLDVRQLDRAAQCHDLVHVLDADTVGDWSPLLRPLEEDTFPAVVIADQDLPSAIASRLPVFRAGYLDEAEVFEVLARQFPRLAPRPLLAKLAEGSLEGIEELARSAETLETLDHCLAERRLPDLRRGDPVGMVATLRALCRSVLGLVATPVSEAARTVLRSSEAAEFLLGTTPTNRYEARNMLVVFFARLRCG